VVTLTVENFLTPAIVTLLGSVATGILTYRATVNKNNTELTSNQAEYVDKQIQYLLESYKGELTALKEEVHNLTIKNQELIVEICTLKLKIMEMEGVTVEGEACKLN
jgi:hypothetical protein